MSAVTSIKKLFSFFGEVRVESDKVTWPGKQEIIVTTIIVFVLAILASLFFSVVDTVIYKIVHAIIGK